MTKINQLAESFTDEEAAEMFAALCQSMSYLEMARILADTFGTGSEALCNEIIKCANGYNTPRR